MEVTPQRTPVTIGTPKCSVSRWKKKPIPFANNARKSLCKHLGKTAQRVGQWKSSLTKLIAEANDYYRHVNLAGDDPSARVHKKS